jgi:hypothetical protein
MKTVKLVKDSKEATTHLNIDGRLVINPGIKCFLPDGTMIRGANKQRNYMKEHYSDSPSLKPAISVKKSEKQDKSKKVSVSTKKKISTEKLPEPIESQNEDKPQTGERPEVIYKSVEEVKEWQLNIIKTMFIYTGKKNIKLNKKHLFQPHYYHQEEVSKYKDVTDCIIHEQSRTVIRACTYLEMIYRGTFLNNVYLPDLISDDMLKDCFVETATAKLLLCKKDKLKIEIFIRRCLCYYFKIIYSEDDPLMPLKNKWPDNIAAFFLDYCFCQDKAVPWFLLFYYRPQYNKTINVDVQKPESKKPGQGKDSIDKVKPKKRTKPGTLLKYVKKCDR